MSQERWTAVDQYISDLLVPDDPALRAALEDSAAAGQRRRRFDDGARSGDPDAQHRRAGDDRGRTRR